jgi:hypothetical protein
LYHCLAHPVNENGKVFHIILMIQSWNHEGDT